MYSNMGYYGYGFDWTYLMVLAGAILTMIASAKVNSTFQRYAKVRSMCGMTAAEVARRILDRNGLSEIPVEHVRGNLSDHYDPTSKVLRLSDSTYNSTSVAAIGVAAHECGHAVQHARGYVPVRLRSMFVPVANIGSYASWILIAIGLLFTGSSSQAWLTAGIVCFAATVVFHIITLPVEFNASSRAVKVLENDGILYGDEIKGARKVLSAAALTYVASAATAILQLLRLIILFGGRDRD